ncbi:hypothetical protein FK220_017865 [Flavobacteriaceae bacterium TP-CH-4]|uniref:Uncharacterized protein n=1 Tax=Pelagihabitans pacificus TaxID=2696054 RepID=A0A967AWJ7_9FLAO|nr:DUF6048 family protein [Pelagihabitans pacificus]NHF61224.1 hypothetical protein [Pelagihabitans pacificus]
MSKYCTNLFFLLVLVAGFGQDKTIDLNPKDTLVYEQPYGLRVGIDLSRPITSFFNDDYTGLEFVGDYRLSQKLYIAGELGNEKKTRTESVGPNEDQTSDGELYDFTASGSYIKVGIDYNTYGNWYGEQNMITVGGRYAFSTFTQTVNNYNIFNSNRYWNPNGFTPGSQESLEFDGRTASWIEGVVGVKMELFKNLYLGGSVRLGILITNPEQDSKEFTNLFIPGFNKVTDGSRFGVGYNYSITYLVPLYKKAKKAEPTPEE